MVGIGEPPDERRAARDQLPVVLPITMQVEIPAPDRWWTAGEWQQIVHGRRARDSDDKWHAFVEGDRLFLHRSWTGAGIFEATFEPAGSGRRITRAVVEGNREIYQRASDQTESVRLVSTIEIIVLNIWPVSIGTDAPPRHRRWLWSDGSC